MKNIICIVLFISVATWAKSKSTYVSECFIKPCQLSGDFDDDGKLDQASLVKATDGKKGIQIKFANGKDAVVGAGTALGNGTNDFSWMDHWDLHKGKIEKAQGKPPKVKGDSLFVEKTESASAIIYWNGSKFKWYQQGD